MLINPADIQEQEQEEQGQQQQQRQQQRQINGYHGVNRMSGRKRKLEEISVNREKRSVCFFFALSKIYYSYRAQVI